MKEEKFLSCFVIDELVNSMRMFVVFLFEAILKVFLWRFYEIFCHKIARHSLQTFFCKKVLQMVWWKFLTGIFIADAQKLHFCFFKPLKDETMPEHSNLASNKRFCNYFEWLVVFFTPIWNLKSFAAEINENNKVAISLREQTHKA